MAEPTPTQYANFGEAVAGILDGYLFDTADWAAEDKNSAFIEGVQIAANYYGIEPQEHPE